VSSDFAHLVARCVLGLGNLERKGSLQRPWLTLVRSGGELAYLRHLHVQLRRLCSGQYRSQLDWIPGTSGGDMARLRFHSEELEGLIGRPPAELWRLCSSCDRQGLGHLTAVLWLDRGGWRPVGRGGLIWARTSDDIFKPLDLLRLHSVIGAKPGNGGGRRSGYQAILVPESGMRSLLRLLRPSCHPSMLGCLRRQQPGVRHGLMALREERGPSSTSLLREAIGFLP